MIMGLAACGLLRLEFSREVNCLVGLWLTYTPDAKILDDSALILLLMLLYMLRRANRFA